MSKRVAFQWLAALGSLCLIILIFDSKNSNPLEHQIQLQTLAVGESAEEMKPTQPHRIPKPNTIPNTKHIAKVANSLEATMQRVINLQRETIRREMEGYQYPNGKYNISAGRLEDLLIEENGKPVRSIILSTWRSGSTFLGEIVNAHPGNFYHYEPLFDFGISQIRGPPLTEKSLEIVRALLNCEHEFSDESENYVAKYFWAFNRNTRLWKHCKAHKSLCHNHSFLKAMCNLFPFRSMKLVRLRLHAAEQLLTDEKLAIRLILLVRDPRGTIQSRKHVRFCKDGRDCSDSALLCADLVSDYKISAELQKKYPTTFRVLRYEDLSVDPYKQVEELYKFYGRDFHPDVKKFLDTHTTRNIDDPFATFRNSNATPFHWRTELEFEEVEEIQRTCATAMEHWGYLPAMNTTHQMEFNPVTDYVLKL